MSETPVEYKGDGTRSAGSTPLLNTHYRFDAPEGYIADEGLRSAVTVALMLGQPLLLTGEPGTGKSLLAHSVAYELNAEVPDERGRLGPLSFHCKTTSTAADLFYRYDALARFHDANRRDGDLPPAEKYVTYEALGLAILLAQSPDAVNPFLPERLKNQGPKRCVILVDEVDKAPRDLPNDILNEVEKMMFTVKETGKTFTADEPYKPILILTSNSERDLPNAFLRRCVFYSVPFPDTARLLKILEARLSTKGISPQTALYAAIVTLFEQIRKIGLHKNPATAELILWARLLESQGATVEGIAAKNPDLLLQTVSLLAKTPEDRTKLTQWLSPR